MNFMKYVEASDTWVDSHYIMGTSTDTITTPADIYANDTTATVGLKGDTEQTGTPTPQNPVMPNGTGDKTANLFDGTLQGGVWEATLTLNTSVNTAVYKSFSVKLPVETYTLSFNHSVNIVRNIVNNVYSETSISNVSNFTFTVNSNYTVYISFRDATSSTTVWDNSQIMLNTGSTPLSYEPYGIKIPISSANTTTPVYLGEVQTTRKIKKLVLDGTEAWYASSNAGVYYTTKSASLNPIYSLGICDRFVYHFVNLVSELAHGEYLIDMTNKYTWLRNNDITSLQDWKAWLAQQYAAGTPVTVWYVLSEPTTGIVNEPLRKIGDYADEVSNITIPTIAGANTLSIGTTLQPSEVTVNYKGWHPVSAVHERESGQWD